MDFYVNTGFDWLRGRRGRGLEGQLACGRGRGWGFEVHERWAELKYVHANVCYLTLLI